MKDLELGKDFLDFSTSTKINEKDKNPKLIFKIEDAICDYFQIFGEQSNGRYKPSYQSKKIQCLERDFDNLN